MRVRDVQRRATRLSCDSRCPRQAVSVLDSRWRSDRRLLPSIRMVSASSNSIFRRCSRRPPDWSANTISVLFRPAARRARRRPACPRTDASERRPVAWPSLLNYKSRPTAFLYNMVRNIVGTLVDVGRGQQPPEWVEQVLLRRPARAGGRDAPSPRTVPCLGRILNWICDATAYPRARGSEESQRTGLIVPTRRSELRSKCSISTILMIG